MSKIFVDTNILVYSLDKHDTRRRQKARSLLRTLQSEHQGVVSTQVLQEFYVAATAKLNVDPLVAKSIVHSLENFEVVAVQPSLIHEAIDCSVLNRVSFWDALIVVSAESARCTVLWTEDLNDGQIMRGVNIENPLNRPR